MILPIETGWGPHPHIVAESPEEMAFWCRHLDVDNDTLLATVAIAGTRVDRVKRELARRDAAWRVPPPNP